MTKIKIGLIGAGYIGGVHAAILSADDRAELVSVYDVETGMAQRLARVCNAKVAESADEVIDRCEAVYITTPNTKHVALAIAAVAAGKHVFCEKPMATNVTDASAVLKAANNSKSIFQVGHNRRFAPVYATLKRMLEESHRPHSAHVKMNRGELLQPRWVGDPNITGGFLYETTIHMFDMLRFLFGEVETLQAIGSNHEYDEVDDFSVLLKFSSGLHATLASSADASWLFPFERVEVFCHHATLVTQEMESLLISKGLAGDSVTQSMHQLPRDKKWGYVQEDRAFIDAIINGSEPVVTALDGFMSVRLVDAVYQSVSSGQRVKVAHN
jgi:myo-inositol 2-dehydrogenase / D-chiro-inositol 1-dehydrogenase